MTEQSLWQQLREEFPQDHVHWRAQTVISRDNGFVALALAYVDARDVMERLDNVLGPENWQDDYEVSGSRTICRLSVRVGGEWITKCDGAGDTAYEAEKGSISDSFKRAAVKFGVARYLYDLPTPWVPCEVKKDGQGKPQFKKFTESPWQRINGRRQPAQQPAAPAQKTATDYASPNVAAGEHPNDSALIREVFRLCVDSAPDTDTLKAWWDEHQHAYEVLTNEDKKRVNAMFKKRKQALTQAEKEAA